ncbi:MAG: glycosyltransferase family 2 protein, partial [Rhodospirillaceae bacterium]
MTSCAPISVFVLTRNEETNLPQLLDTIAGWAEEIVLVDSFSTDRTLEIGLAHDCRIIQNPFVNHAVQCNYALDHGSFAHDWLLRLDADEIMPEALKAELALIACTAPAEVTGVYLDRRIYYMNRWLRHGGLYPNRILRMFRHDAGRFELRTEEHFLLTRGHAMVAKNDFLENNRNNTLKYWLGKHADLSDGEVADTMTLDRPNSEGIKPRLFGVKAERTRWLKTRIYRRAPLFARAFLYFIYRYIFRLGFLDGVPGLIFHVNQGFWYRFFVDARIYEQRSG